MSKVIEAYIAKHPEKFASYHNEDHNERGLDYWVYCREPYFCPSMECGTIHEDTVADTMRMMRTVIKGQFNGYGWEAIPEEKVAKGEPVTGEMARVLGSFFK